MIAETLEEWAARTAHLFDAEGWAGINADDDTDAFLAVLAKHPVRADFPEIFAALRAYRDGVVAGLSKPQRQWLMRFCNGWGYGGAGGSVVLRSLEKKGLAEPEATCPACGSITHYTVVVSEFGSECARVLGTPNGAKR